MFFQPVPAEPRVPPVQRQPTTTEWLVAWTSTGIFIVAVVYFGWELLWHGAILGLLLMRPPSRAVPSRRSPVLSFVF